MPRFDYEGHVEALVNKRDWPDSTRQISELRIAIEYQSQRGSRTGSRSTSSIIRASGCSTCRCSTKSYETWSAESLRLSRNRAARSRRRQVARLSRDADPEGAADEQAALTAARLFTEYLRACRDVNYGMSLLPPGRFLMPGELAGSPALTFAPLDLPGEG